MKRRNDQAYTVTMDLQELFASRQDLAEELLLGAEHAGTRWKADSVILVLAVSSRYTEVQMAVVRKNRSLLCLGLCEGETDARTVRPDVRRDLLCDTAGSQAEFLHAELTDSQADHLLACLEDGFGRDYPTETGVLDGTTADILYCWQGYRHITFSMEAYQPSSPNIRAVHACLDILFQ